MMTVGMRASSIRGCPILFRTPTGGSGEETKRKVYKRLDSTRVTRDRRAFLRAVGASAVALPFMRLLEHSAAAVDAPLRLVTMYHPHSASSPLFTMQSGDTETSFSLAYQDSVLVPLEPFRKKLAVIEGLDLVHAAGHDAPHTLFAGSIGNTPTIDQYLAVQRGLGDATLITSLTLAVGTGEGGNIPNVISLGMGGAVIPPISSPRVAFDKVFGLASTIVTPSAYTQGKSRLDYLRADITRLQSRLAPTELYKLDQHLTALRDIEKRLESVRSFNSAQCSTPPEPPSHASYSTWNAGGHHANEDHDLHIDIIAQAFACDATRFVSFLQGDLSRGATAGTGLESEPAYGATVDVHNSIAHSYSPDNLGSCITLGVQNRYNYSKMALLMARLQELDLLDDTLIVMAGEMGDPGLHSSRDIPVVVAGDAHGAFKVGRRIQLKDDCPEDSLQCNVESGTSMTKLLVSVANAFGDELNGFGAEPDVGRLSELET